jgi:hypothetical protein
MTGYSAQTPDMGARMPKAHLETAVRRCHLGCGGVDLRLGHKGHSLRHALGAPLTRHHSRLHGGAYHRKPLGIVLQRRRPPRPPDARPPDARLGRRSLGRHFFGRRPREGHELKKVSAGQALVQSQEAREHVLAGAPRLLLRGVRHEGSELAVEMRRKPVLGLEAVQQPLVRRGSEGVLLHLSRQRGERRGESAGPRRPDAGGCGCPPRL